jgi:hypothetical protein
MISEFKTIPKAVYYVQTAAGCTVLDPDGDTLAEITAPGGYFPGIAAADGGPGTVTFSAPVKRVVGPFDLAPQLQLTLLGQLGGNGGDNGGLPAGYKRVAYLESTGTQCIDTGLEMDSVKTGTKTKYLEINTNKNFSNVFGAWSNDGREYSWMLKPNNRAWLNVSLNFYCEVNGIPRGNLNEVDAYIHDYDAENNEAWLKCYVNGTLRIDGYKQLFPLRNEYKNSVLLYGYTGNGAPVPTFVGRIYYVELYKDDVKIGHFIPCIDRIGTPCMFDMVTRQPFYNCGSGEFLYPGKETEVSTFSLRRSITYAQLTEHGLRRLYHAPANYKGELIDYALENGYKPIVEPEKPEEGYWSPRWTETEDEIVLEWVETEPPTDEFGMLVPDSENLTQPTE